VFDRSGVGVESSPGSDEGQGKLSWPFRAPILIPPIGIWFTMERGLPGKLVFGRIPYPQIEFLGGGGGFSALLLYLRFDPGDPTSRT